MKRTPKNKRIIAACYALNALHCFIGYLSALLEVTRNDTSIILFGILLVAMIPLSILDTRPSMTGKAAVWITIALHTVLDCIITILSACYLIGYLSVLETIIIVIVCYKGKRLITAYLASDGQI